MKMVHGNCAVEQSSKRQCVFGRKAVRIAIVLFCVGGFLYQSIEFLNLYWTYPTVVDIQESSPASLDLPAVTICNPIGYNYTAICSDFSQPVCIQPFLFRRYFSKFFCEIYPKDCIDNKLPSDMTGMLYNRFLSGIESISYEEHDKLRLALEDYMNCTIEFNGKTTNCNLQYVMGSFYTRDAMPQYCYTIYSLWGQPEKQRERIRKGAIAKRVAEDDCIMLADHYNQPCDYLSYDSTKEEIDIVVIRSLVIENHTEEVETKIPFHDCTIIKVWRPECSLIDINILFDRFEITKVKYNPKFEQLELFSAIGGYMGMWLGVSLVVIYDYIGAALGYARTWALKWRKSSLVLQLSPQGDVPSIYNS